MNSNEEEKAVLKYVALFGIAYFILRLIVGLFLSLIGDLYYTTILIIGTSASLAAYRFLEDNARIFDKAEKIRVIVGSFLCVLVTNLIFLPREKMIFRDGIGFLFVFVQVIDLLILWFIYGPVTKSIHQRRQQST